MTSVAGADEPGVLAQQEGLHPRGVEPTQRLGAAWGGFLRERYGIQLGYQFPDDTVAFDVAQRMKWLQALETYRALDPSLVVENERLRWIGCDTTMSPDVLGVASVFGDIRINASPLMRLRGKKRDPSGQETPRMSDDAELEAMTHEIGHAISYRTGIPFATQYRASAALPARAWIEWENIHNSSTSGESLVLKSLREMIAKAEVRLAAKRNLGHPEDDSAVQVILEELRYLRRREQEILGQSEFFAGGTFPSWYASTNLHEDFAESIALAQLQPAEFRTNYAPRYAWFQKWMPRVVP